MIGATVAVSFHSANPRNNQRIEGSFLTVDRLGDDGQWSTIYVDGDWCTKYIWRGESLGVSFADIKWETTDDTQPGLHRICHYGTRKTLLGEASTSLLHVPDWLVTTGLGSAAASVAMHVARLVASLSHVIHRKLGVAVSRTRYKVFNGCSKTFLVRKPA